MISVWWLLLVPFGAIAGAFFGIFISALAARQSMILKHDAEKQFEENFNVAVGVMIKGNQFSWRGNIYEITFVGKDNRED
jgi:hypothetical protein